MAARAKPGAAQQIESVTIEGSKSIVDQTIPLGRLNVLIGANGAGKTALLEAIGVLGAAVEGRVDDAALLRRGVRPGVPRLYKSAFAEGRLPSGIKLRARSTDGGEYAVMPAARTSAGRANAEPPVWGAKGPVPAGAPASPRDGGKARVRRAYIEGRGDR